MCSTILSVVRVRSVFVPSLSPLTGSVFNVSVRSAIVVLNTTGRDWIAKSVDGIDTEKIQILFCDGCRKHTIVYLPCPKTYTCIRSFENIV